MQFAAPVGMLANPRSLSFALLVLASTFAGCSSPDPYANGDETATTAPKAVPKSVVPSGIYKVEGSPDYAWLKLDAAGRYGVWLAGDRCNADPANAPASCLVVGSYQVNESQSQILFTDDLTGTDVVSPFEVTAFEIPGTTTTQNTGSGGGSGGSKGGGSGGSGSGNGGSGDSQKPVATAWNLKKCLQTIAVVCNLMSGNPEPVPEILRPLPPRAGQVSQG